MGGRRSSSPSFPACAFHRPLPSASPPRILVNAVARDSSDASDNGGTRGQRGVMEERRPGRTISIFAAQG
eukprot:12059169-Alexandrium_andersonii.AAC.1